MPEAVLQRSRPAARRSSSRAQAAREATRSSGRSTAIARGSRARRDPNDWRVVADERRRPPLHAADDAQPSARSARASGCSTCAPAIPDRLKIEHARAGDARAVRRPQSRDRRRVPEGRTAVSRARRAESTRPASVRQVLRGARSDPRRRRVQHAAAADAVGHRPARGARGARHPRARRSARRRQNLQDRYEVAVVNRMDVSGVGRARRRDASRAATRSIGDGRRTGSGVYTTNGAVLSVILRSSRRPPVAGPVLLRAARPTSTATSRATRSCCRDATTTADVGGAQGAHEQHGRRGHAALGRSARAAARSTSTTSKRATTRATRI